MIARETARQARGKREGQGERSGAFDLHDPEGEGRAREGGRGKGAG